MRQGSGSSASHRVHEVQQALQRADVERAQAGARVEETLSRLHESDAQLAAVVEQLSQLTAQGAPPAPRRTG